jgi:hypothetical protein
MTHALVVFGAAVLGVFTGFVTASWQTRKHLEAEYDLDLRKRRIEVYRELWKRLQPLALYSAPQPVTYLAAAKLAKDLRRWYYEMGGLFISERTREPYFDLQKALAGILELRGEHDLKEPIDGESAKLLKALASRLRTSMTDDVATRVKPRLASSFISGLHPNRPDVNVAVRRSWDWTTEPVEGYLVTVENLSRSETFDLESVRFEVGSGIDVPPRDRERPLTHRLQPRGKWEGWVAADSLAGNPIDVGRLATARLSNGHTIKSQPTEESPVDFSGRLDRDPAVPS